MNNLRSYKNLQGKDLKNLRLAEVKLINQV